MSIITAVQAMDALDPRRYDVLPILITKQGQWLTSPLLRQLEAYKDLAALIARCDRVLLRAEPNGNRLHIEQPGPFGVRRSRSVVVDCVIPIVHGTFGEDGTLQGLFELADIPFAGPGVVGSAVGMDKIVMKLVFRAHGLPITRFQWFARERWERDRASLLDDIERDLRYPLFVKPANLGSSIGISTAHGRDQLTDAIDVAAHYDRRLLVEESVSSAREINCSVLGSGDDFTVSVCEEPIGWTEILSYEDKYMRGGKGSGGMEQARRRIPADISAELTARIQQLAVEAFRSIDCAGVARIDFLLGGDDSEVYVNEINTIPGSLSFYLWEASGVPFSSLMDRLIDIAFTRHRDRARTTYGIDSQLLQQFTSRGAKGKAASE